MKFFKCQKCGSISETPGSFIYNRILIEEGGSQIPDFLSPNRNNFAVNSVNHFGKGFFDGSRRMEGAANRSENEFSGSPGQRNETRRKGSGGGIRGDRTLNASDFVNHFATKAKIGAEGAIKQDFETRGNRFFVGKSKMKKSENKIGRSLSQNNLHRNGKSSFFGGKFSKKSLIARNTKGNDPIQEVKESKNKNVFNSKNYRNSIEDRNNGNIQSKYVFRSRNITPNKSKLRLNNKKSKLKSTWKTQKTNIKSAKVNFEAKNELFKQNFPLQANQFTERRKKFFDLQSSPSRSIPNFHSNPRNMINRPNEAELTMSQISTQKDTDLIHQLSPNKKKFLSEFQNMSCMNFNNNGLPLPSFSERHAQSMKSGDLEILLQNNHNSQGFDRKKRCRVPGCNNKAVEEFCSTRCSQIWYHNTNGGLSSVSEYDSYMKSQPNLIGPMFGQVSSSFGVVGVNGFSSQGFASGSSKIFNSGGNGGLKKENFFHEIRGIVFFF